MKQSKYTPEQIAMALRQAATVRVAVPPARLPNERWAMDFMHDTLASEQTVRVLTVMDLYTRECVALVLRRRFQGAAGHARGCLPQRVNVDNGREFTSRALDHWAYWNRVQLDFGRPGTPSDNPFIESFNATVRRECLSRHGFLSVADAQRTLDDWQEDDDTQRPHTALGRVPPAVYRRGGRWIARPLSWPPPQNVELANGRPAASP